MKIYGSLLCGDCVACKEAFDQCGITYEFINIFDSLANLKEFLTIRDKESIFDGPKQSNSIGIPCCIDENHLFLDWEAYLKENNYSYEKKEVKMCSLDHKNC